LDWAQTPKGNTKIVKSKNLRTKDIMISLVRIAFGAKAKDGTTEKLGESVSVHKVDFQSLWQNCKSSEIITLFSWFSIAKQYVAGIFSRECLDGFQGFHELEHLHCLQPFLGQAYHSKAWRGCGFLRKIAFGAMGRTIEKGGWC